MSKEELKKLESKIDQLSKQLRDTRKAISDANKVVLDAVTNNAKGIGKLSTEIALISKASRAIRRELERRTERRMFFRGLIMGLILGILGNLLVSYWMEYLKAFDISYLGWALGTAAGFLVVLYLIWQLHRESRR